MSRLALFLLAAPAAAIPQPFCRLPRACERQQQAQSPVTAIGRLRGGQKPDAVAEGLADAKAALSQWWNTNSNRMGSAGAAGGVIDSDAKKASALMKKRGLSNCVKAMELLRGAHKRNPDNVELKVQ